MSAPYMTRPIYHLTALLGLLAAIFACPCFAANPYSAYYSTDSNKLFWFIVVTDTHIGATGSSDSSNLSWVVTTGKNVVAPEFIVATGDLTDSTNGNWLGYPNGPYQAEWDEYKAILGANVSATNYYDLPGNHDAYNDQYFAYYRANSIQGQATGQTQVSWTREFDFGKYHFLGVNTADNSGNGFSLIWPYGDYAGLDQGELAYIENELGSHSDSDLTLIFGHHPVTDTGVSTDTWLYYGAPAFIRLLDTYSASLYGYGHTHAYSKVLFSGNTYTGFMAGDGIVYLNTNSLGKSSENQFNVIAIDCNGISTKVQTIRSWPLVMITTPVNLVLGSTDNPYAFDVPNAVNNPIRALVFDANTVSGVQYRIDSSAVWKPMQPVSGNPRLWEALWDASALSAGRHTIEVQATGSAILSDIISVNVAVTNIPDTTPPAPNPMTWLSPPQATTSESIAMTATTATDHSGVEYYFDCVSDGCHDSNWQAGNTYTDTGLVPGTEYSYNVKARDMSINLNETLPSQPAAAVTHSEGTGTVAVALSEKTTLGTTAGSYLNTQGDDGNYEALTEVIKSGKWSALEHAWTFDVAGSASVTFNVQAHHSPNSETDHFVFAYSLDNVTFHNMLIVSKDVADNTYQSFSLPPYTSGTVYVRVLDTDRTRGNLSLETLYVDDMFIVCSGDISLSEPAFNPNPPNASINVDINPSLTWTPGSGALWHDVYFGTVDNMVLVSAAQSDAFYNPGSLTNGTTYMWRVDEGNSSGITTGTAWQFTTISLTCTPQNTIVKSIVTSTLKGPAGTSYGQAVVTVTDNCGTLLQGASVTGQFTGDFSDVPPDGQTDSNGVAIFKTNSSLRKPTFGFEVTNISYDGLSYQQ